MLFMHDADLMARVAAGETGLFGVLVERHEAAALARAVAILKDRSLAEDAVQDAFLDAWRRAEAYRPELGSARSWLLRIVHNRAIDVRRRLAHQARLAELVSVEPVSQHPDPHEVAARRETTAVVRRALQGLPASQREVLGRAYYADQSLSQVASSINAPLGTTKSRARAGLARLRMTLAA